MHRRRALAAALTGLSSLSGCLGVLDAVGDTEADTGISIERDDVPEALDLSFTVDVEEPPTAEAPAKLRITMHNQAGSGASNVAQTLSAGPAPPFSGRIGESADGDELVLEPLVFEGMETAAQIEGRRCWRASEWRVESIRENASGDDQRVTLDAGGGLYLTYYLLAHPDTDGCMPAGTYRFESGGYGLEDRSWGFELTLSEDLSRRVAASAEESTGTE